MISQPMANENFVILTPSGLKILQTEKPKATSHSQDNVAKHRKADFKVLGTIQILCGAMVLCLGITLRSASFSPYFTKVFSSLLTAGYPSIGGLCFIVAGSLSVITEKKSSKILVWCCVGANILSSLSALVGLSLLSVNLSDLSHPLRGCELATDDRAHEDHHLYYESSVFDNTDCSMGQTLLTGVLSMTLICTVLELFLAVLTVVIWWKQHRSNFPGSVIFLPNSYRTLSVTSQKGARDSTYEELLT